MARNAVFTTISAILLLGNLAAIGASGRQRAREAVCLSNVRQLSQAWLTYSQDNDGKLVSGQTGRGNWVDRSMSGNSKEQKLDAIRRGLLFPYVGDVRIYRCPAQEAQKDPNWFCLRSFAIAGGANGEVWHSYIRVTEYTELENPAVRYIFLEEPEVRGTLPGSWQMNPNTRTWVDPVAMWHDRKTTLGLADGHVETHTWRDRSFIDWNLQAMYSPSVFTFNMVPPADEPNDIDYMAKGFPYKSLR